MTKNTAMLAMCLISHMPNNTKPKYGVNRMEGLIEVDYTVMCKNDVSLEVSLKEILSNEKIMRAIKGEFAKGLRNIALESKEDTTIFLKTEKRYTPSPPARSTSPTSSNWQKRMPANTNA